MPFAMSNLLDERLEWALSPIKSEEYEELEWSLKVLDIVRKAAWERDDWDTYRQCIARSRTLYAPLMELNGEAHRRVEFVTTEFRNSEYSVYGRC